MNDVVMNEFLNELMHQMKEISYDHYVESVG